MRTREGRSAPPWMWISIGVGSGLLITMAVGLGLRYLRSREEADPRAQQVEELLEEAERLLAQGRRAGAGRRGPSAD